MIANIISPFQTGLVSRRNITENIVVQEMLHSMSKMRSEVGFFDNKLGRPTQSLWSNSLEFYWKGS